jgi:hypothetical protein
MLIYSRVNCAFSPIYALSRTHLMNFKTASRLRLDVRQIASHMGITRIVCDALKL